MASRVPKLKHSIKLGKLKAEATAAGAGWVSGENSPVGFSASAELVQAVERG